MSEWVAGWIVVVAEQGQRIKGTCWLGEGLCWSLELNDTAAQCTLKTNLKDNLAVSNTLRNHRGTEPVSCARES